MRRAFHAPHELVARDAGEGVVSALELKVRVANPGEEDSDESESSGRPRHRHLAGLRSAGFEDVRLHGRDVSPPVR
jgi:hypothetical protein